MRKKKGNLDMAATTRRRRYGAQAIWLYLCILVGGLLYPANAQAAGGQAEGGQTKEEQEGGPQTDATQGESPNNEADASPSAPEFDQPLLSLDARIRATVESLEAARAKLPTTESKAERDALEAAISALGVEKTALEHKFESIASGVDLTPFHNPESEKFNLRGEVESLLEPLVRQLKSATEGPRLIEHLRNQLALYEQLSELSDNGLKNVQEKIAKAPEDLQHRLENTLKIWQQRKQSAESQKQVTDFELRTRLLARKPFLDSAGSFFDSFFRSRGMNLLIGIGAFLIVFLSMRIFHRRVLGPIYIKKSRSFYTRAANVLFHLFTVVAAVATVLLALFTVSDWILLVLVLLFLVGVGWAFIQMIPHFFEQLRMLLNLGSVREQERIVLNGLPWRVDALMLHTRLVNPQLTGGELRIPVRDLIGLHSRPPGDTEPWFPCNESDWVILADGTRGRVLLQTPDMVRLELPGGGYVTHQTAEFLGLAPRNLSAGFRVQITFGIDYEYQSKCTDEIPKLMTERLRRNILSLVSEDEIHRLEVEFREAAASSLDFEVQGDFKGGAARLYEPLHRAMARALVEACNENGWVIPFTQLTLHQA